MDPVAVGFVEKVLSLWGPLGIGWIAFGVVLWLSRKDLRAKDDDLKAIQVQLVTLIKEGTEARARQADRMEAVLQALSRSP